MLTGKFTINVKSLTHTNHYESSVHKSILSNWESPPPSCPPTLRRKKTFIGECRLHTIMTLCIAQSRQISIWCFKQNHVGGMVGLGAEMDPCLINRSPSWPWWLLCSELKEKNPTLSKTNEVLEMLTTGGLQKMLATSGDRRLMFTFFRFNITDSCQLVDFIHK